MSLDQEFIFEALGTRWWITTAEPLTNEQNSSLLKIVSEFQSAYSRFDPESVIGKLNEKKLLNNPTPELLEMLSYSIDMYQATEGVFNISIGSALEKSGYGQLSDASSKVSGNLTNDLSVSKSEVRIKPWVRIDFGGFGKGWLIDLLVNHLHSLKIDMFIVNGGGDIYVSGQAELLHIEHPFDPSLVIGEVTVKDGSLCSSSAQKRIWKSPDGKNVSHIQAATDHETDSIASVHLRAETTLISDTLATVFLLVDHPTRLELADKFSIEFLEVMSDLSFWQSTGFGFKAYR